MCNVSVKPDLSAVHPFINIIIMSFTHQANSLGDIYVGIITQERRWEYMRDGNYVVHLHHECTSIYSLRYGHLCGVVFVSWWTHEGACRASSCCAALMRSVIYECLAAASEGIISQSQSVMCTKGRQGERIHLPFSASLPFSSRIHSTFHLRPPSPLLQDFSSMCLTHHDIDDHMQSADYSASIKNILTSQSLSLCFATNKHASFEIIKPKTFQYMFFLSLSPLAVSLRSYFWTICALNSAIKNKLNNELLHFYNILIWMTRNLHITIQIFGVSKNKFKEDNFIQQGRIKCDIKTFTFYKKIVFQINAIYFSFLFIKESWRKKKHGFHKIIVHHYSFKHCNKKKYLLITISANYKK